MSEFNEDDTFERLKRTPISEMVEFIQSLSEIQFMTLMANADDIRDQWLKKHGWTLNEYSSSIRKYHSRKYYDR